MPTTLPATTTSSILGRLSSANQVFMRSYPGDAGSRQPVQTVYGGAHLFTFDTARKLAELARKHFATYAPNATVFGEAMDLPVALRERVYSRVCAKLESEAVEDFRIDFEDGFGSRPDPEEDAVAEQAAREVAKGMRMGTLPPFIGIRIKSMGEETKRRSARTLDLFISTLLGETGGVLPPNFVVTLPKIPVPEQVTACVELLEQLEHYNALPLNTIRMEIMVELTQSLVDREGRCNLPLLLDACRGRCVAAHFGTYDYTASASVTAAEQRMDHPSCDFAKQMMMVAYAGRGIYLSDGATNVMPVGPHRGTLTPHQERENAVVVHRAWKLAYGHIRHSLTTGFYQGWDLHPGQFAVRYAACYSFFLEGADAAGERLRNFIDKAAQATLVGDVFDDAATGQGLLNYFLRSLNCGAVTIDEVTATGLTLDEIAGRSFLRILENRRQA